jgi:hypothetical protein
MLLEPHVWHGISLNDYVSWANEIWHILALRATRRYVLLVCLVLSNAVLLAGSIVYIVNIFFRADLREHLIPENTF